MQQGDLEKIAMRNVRSFTLFRVFFSARFYYPVYALLFLDYGLTLAQFGLLNAVWAATIVLAEVPSGALADTIGRRKLLIVAGALMMAEMVVLLVAPVDSGGLLFGLFLLNRILSGLAEAAASGADEALVYDSLKAAGLTEKWGHVLERVQRDTSLAFFFAMMIGAAVYDPEMVNAVVTFLGFSYQFEQADLLKWPIGLTFFSSIIVFSMALRMHETAAPSITGILATLSQSTKQTLLAAHWIWTTAFPFGIILAAMVLDSVIRQFLTLASEYWNVIQWPIATYGLIGSGMALMGLFVPRLARILAERLSPQKNFMITASMVFIGLLGLTFVIPYWGIAPAILLYAAMGMMHFFVSRYLNETSPSGQRATILSFRGLSTNFAYGAVSILYAGLILRIKSDAGVSTPGADPGSQVQSVFVDSLAWLPWYFLFTLIVVCIVHRLRFRSVRPLSSSKCLPQDKSG